MPASNDDNDKGNDERSRYPMSMDSRVYLLAERIKNLTNEVKQLKAMLASDRLDLITRLSKLEITYQRIFGFILVFPILGAVLGFIATYWAALFRPWTKP